MKEKKIAQTAAYFIAFAALGMAMASLGPTLPGLATRTASTVAAISFLFTVRSGGFLLGSLFSGKFYDRLNAHQVLAGTIIGMAVMMAIMPLVSVLWLLLAAMLLLGTAEGALGVGGNALIVWVHGHRVAPYMNALHFTYCVGGFIAPLIINITQKVRDTVGAPYLVLAILMLPAAAFVLRLPSPTSPHVLEQGAGPAPPPNYRLVILIALLLCLYIGAEVSYGSWIFSYTVKMGLGGEGVGQYLTSLFWGSLAVGRLAGVPIAARLKPRTVLLADLIGCLISIGIALARPSSLASVTVATVCIGLSMASIYPTALNFAEQRLRITGQVTGFLIVGGSAGGMVVPLLVGQMFESIGPLVMLYTVLIDLAVGLLVYLAMVFDRTARITHEKAAIPT